MNTVITEMGCREFLHDFISVHYSVFISLSSEKKYKKTRATERLVQKIKYFDSLRVVRRFWVKFQCRGVLLIWIIVGQGSIALAVGAGGGCLDIFFLSNLSFLCSFSLSGRRPDIDCNTISKGR